MSQLLISAYLKQLDLIKKVSGSHRETIVREAFKDLLKAWGRQYDLVFLAEYPLKTAAKKNIALDGAVVHELRMPLGYWEAKDEKDDLNSEIVKKFKKGYPQDNIIFSDDVTAVLIQNKSEVFRCHVTDTVKLAQLLKLFFGFERPEIANFRAAVTQFKVDLPTVLLALRGMIEHEHKQNAKFRKADAKFLEHARDVINPNLTRSDVREMLIQHILTEEIFAKVFDDSDFHQHNNVARELYALEAEFFTGNLKKQTLKGLEPYYAAIRSAAAQISSHGEKQAFLKIIYENFYKVYNKKAADRLGVVYTPNEIVRFMIDGADWLTEKYFNKSIIDKDVQILDPATGTGTFICELMEHFRGQPAKLKQKYLNELYANEVAILPYYVANLNIEATYAAITGSYEEFPNLCFVDTLDNVGLHTAAKGTSGQLFGSVSEENVLRIKRQNSKRISVVIGNPPYNANQANENDNNKNRTYPSIDARIKQTYIAESTAQKTKLYDMYARFFRWASDRLDDNGVLAFVTNRSFIESRTFDGFRKTVRQEFSEIYIVDLGGDVRANPKLSGTKNNVFGIQTGVAISFMVKHACPPKDKKPARVFYIRRPELETSDEKLGFLAHNALSNLTFDQLQPDTANNWVNLTDNDFESLLPLASKATKAAKTASKERAIFKLFTNGVNTARDDWVYDHDAPTLQAKVEFMIGVYNKEFKATQQRGKVDEKLTSKVIKWSAGLFGNVGRIAAPPFSSETVTRSAYRPFFELKYYADPIFSDRLTGGHGECFGKDFSLTPMCFALTAPGAAVSFSALAVAGLADWHFLGDTQLYPIRRTADGIEVDNITDWALKQFNSHYNKSDALTASCATGKNAKAKRKISKDAIFYYCYAVLHDPIYRGRYAQNLKRDYPRIPFYSNFWQWESWGKTLASLHVNYRTADLFKIERSDTPDKAARAAGMMPKVILRADKVAGTIEIDSETTLTGIPPEAWDYKIGSRCALDWILDQYKEKRPNDLTIREKFDSYRFADYKEEVIELLARLTTISIETLRIARAMEKAAR